MAPRLGHSVTQKCALRCAFRGLISSRLLLEPLLARGASGPAFGVLGAPEMCVLGHVSLFRVPSCVGCPQCDATLPLVCGGFAVCLGGCT